MLGSAIHHSFGRRRPPQEAKVQIHLVCSGQGRDLLEASALKVSLDLDQQLAVALPEAIRLQCLAKSPCEGALVDALDVGIFAGLHILAA